MNSNSISLHSYQKRFIDFLVCSSALTFGEFVLKSGRKTPYFVNTENFNDGEKVTKIGQFYASHIAAQDFSHIDSIFGPAYKGISLSVTTAISLSQDQGMNVGYTFDRGEEKSHGVHDNMIGFQVKDGQQILIVEDVITAGVTLKEIIPLIYKSAKVEILGVVISVDRCEKGSGKLSAVAEVAKTLGVQVYPIVTIHDITAYLSSENTSGLTLSPQQQDDIARYLEEYGA